MVLARYTVEGINAVLGFLRQEGQAELDCPSNSVICGKCQDPIQTAPSYNTAYPACLGLLVSLKCSVDGAEKNVKNHVS